MRKKRLCALLAALMILPLSACGKGKKAEPSPAPSAVLATAPAQNETPSPAPTTAFATAPVKNETPSPAPTAVFATAPVQNETPAPTEAPSPTPKAAIARPKATAEPTPTFIPIETPAPILRTDVTPSPTAPSAAPPATPAADAAPSATPVPTPEISALAPVITKQPSGESHNAGESAVFITHADNWNSLKWTAVSPSGREIDLKTFRETFPDSTVTGDNETSLSISNLNIDMSGWSFFCTFINDDGSVPTAKARLKVNAVPGTAAGANGERVSTRILLCPYCKEEVFRSMVNCPYCGGVIYDGEKDYFVYQDGSGNIFYMDETGSMFYDSGLATTTFEDHINNYAIFDADGKPTFGNYEKERQDLEDHWLLVQMGVYPN